MWLGRRRRGPSEDFTDRSSAPRRRRPSHLCAVRADTPEAAAARVTGQPYPNDFDRAWKSVLFNQFHDIMAGTSLEVAYDDVRDQLARQESKAGQ